jgi:uncharacterized membrane protein YkoI
MRPCHVQLTNDLEHGRMNSFKKLLMALAALAALAVGGAAIANAMNSASNNGTATQSETHDDGADASLVGTSAADKAAKAAKDKLGGGTVVSVEKSDEGGPAVYEVKVDNAGTVTEVQVDGSYNVTATKADDDQHGADQGDGDGETNDD